MALFLKDRGCLRAHARITDASTREVGTVVFVIPSSLFDIPFFALVKQWRTGPLMTVRVNWDSGAGKFCNIRCLHNFSPAVNALLFSTWPKPVHARRRISGRTVLFNHASWEGNVCLGAVESMRRTFRGACCVVSGWSTCVELH